MTLRKLKANLNVMKWHSLDTFLSVGLVHVYVSTSLLNCSLIVLYA